MRSCSICIHPKRKQIDQALVSGTSYRRIATQFVVSEAAARRHKANHLPDRLIVAHEQQEREANLDVMTELRRTFERVNKLFDACDRWLTDPDDPGRYDVGPRAQEIKVTYEDHSGEQPVTRKATLAELLRTVEADTGFTITMVETKHADIRELLLKTAARLHPQIELLGRLVGDLDESSINIFVTPVWGQIEQTLMAVLVDHPDARTALSDGLAQLEQQHR